MGLSLESHEVPRHAANFTVPWELPKAQVMSFLACDLGL